MPSRDGYSRGPAERAKSALGDRFALAMVATGVLALAVRWWVVLVARPTCSPPLTGSGSCFRVAGLSLWYHGQGRLVGDGEGFAHPFQYLETGDLLPSALHPPAYSTFLGGFSAIGLDTATQHRLLSGLLGVLAVVLVGYLGRRLAGDRAGVIAAATAAVYPMLWINDGMMQTESLYAPVAAGMLLAAYRFVDRPTFGRIAALGAIIGLAALTRPEATLFVVVLLIPLVWFRTDASAAVRARWIGTGLLAAALVVTPWVVRNLLTFDNPVLLTNSTGSVVAESTCESTYYGEFIGYQADCHPGFPLPAAFGGDESVREAQLLEQADDYLFDHLDRLPVVAAARVGRVWDVFNPGQNADLNRWYEGRGNVASSAGSVVYFLLIPPAVWGGAVLWRRRVTLLPLLSTVVVVTAAAAATFGLTRYRVPAEVALVALAAVGLDEVLVRPSARFAARRSTSSAPPTEASTTMATSAGMRNRPSP